MPPRRQARVPDVDDDSDPLEESEVESSNGTGIYEYEESENEPEQENQEAEDDDDEWDSDGEGGIIGKKPWTRRRQGSIGSNGSGGSRGSDRIKFINSDAAPETPDKGGPLKIDDLEASKSRPQTGPTFGSAVPRYASTPERVNRESRLFSRMNMVLYTMQDHTFKQAQKGVFVPHERKPERVTTSWGEASGYWRHKKLATVNYMPVRPKTTGRKNDEPKEWPPHLKHMKQLNRRAERDDLLKRYSQGYKAKVPKKWDYNAVFSFVADSFVSTEQVDETGKKLPSAIVDEDGERSDRRQDVQILRQIKTLKIDGAKLHNSTPERIGQLLRIPVEQAEVLKQGMQQYQSLNEKVFTENMGFEAFSAAEALREASAETQEAKVVEELMLTELKVRKHRALLQEVQKKLKPLDAKFEQAGDDMDNIEEQLHRVDTTRLSRSLPGTRQGKRALLKMRRNIEGDLTKTYDHFSRLKELELDLSVSVREYEVSSLELRDKAVHMSFERQLKAEEMRKEAEERAEMDKADRNKVMLEADLLLREAQMKLEKVSTTDNLDIKARGTALEQVRDKIHEARKMYQESSTLHKRQRRLDAVQSMYQLEENCRKLGDAHLDVARRHVFAAISAPVGGTTTFVDASLLNARSEIQTAIRHYKRNGALGPSPSPWISPNPVITRDKKAVSGVYLKTNTDGMWWAGKAWKQVREVEDRLEAAEKKVEMQRAKSKALSRPSTSAAPGDKGVNFNEPSEGVVLDVKEEDTGFRQGLDDLIERKKVEAMATIGDSLCGMQAWLFHVKEKAKAAKANAAAEAAEGSVYAASEGTASTLPALRGAQATKPLR